MLPSKSGYAIMFIVLGMFFISVNDMVIKRFSGEYPLHQMVFLRSAIGLLFTLILIQLEGGWRILKTDQPGLHALRAVMVFASNMTYFAALAVLPLPDATALFFIAPIMITVLSIPILGERVGSRRWGAVIVGFCGTLIMVRAQGSTRGDVSIWIYLLPILAAFFYATMQVLTRKLAKTKASAMAFYIQITFVLFCGISGLIVGNGQFADGVQHPSLVFLLRAWIVPSAADMSYFVLIGILATGVGYCLSQAYRSAPAATVAPFEYVLLPMSIMWGWVIFADWPGLPVWFGSAIIIAAGLYV
ncbi:MAG: DMT family transporter, partial [Rhodobacteraceae bacterium]|nr:DMT family transporter [Paracoccaceae bacterium]